MASATSSSSSSSNVSGDPFLDYIRECDRRGEKPFISEHHDKESDHYGAQSEHNDGSSEGTKRPKCMTNVIMGKISDNN